MPDESKLEDGKRIVSSDPFGSSRAEGTAFLRRAATSVGRWLRYNLSKGSPPPALRYTECTLTRVYAVRQATGSGLSGS